MALKPNPYHGLTSGGFRREIVVHGHPTVFWEYGSPAGLPVILVHGFRGDHHGLEIIANGLINARVIVPDLPGFGETPAFRSKTHALTDLGRWLLDFCEAMLTDEFILVGHSFGTLVVSEALAQGIKPQNVVLINPISAPALKGPRALMSQLALLYYNVARVLPTSAGNAILRSPLIVRSMSNIMAKTKNPGLRAWIHDQHAKYFSSFSDRDSLNTMFRESITATVQDRVDAFTMPTWIVAADRDDITPLSEQLALARRIPNASLIVVPDVGHLIHYEAPEIVSELIEERVSALSSGHPSRPQHSQ